MADKFEKLVESASEDNAPAWVRIKRNLDAVHVAIENGVTKQQMADAMGITRQAFGAALKKAEGSGNGVKECNRPAPLVEAKNVTETKPSKAKAVMETGKPVINDAMAALLKTK